MIKPWRRNARCSLLGCRTWRAVLSPAGRRGEQCSRCYLVRWFA